MFDPHKTRMIVIRQPGFDLLWQQWSLLNCFCTVQGHCGACRGLTENDGHENDGPSKLQDMKLQDMKLEDKQRKSSNRDYITMQFLLLISKHATVQCIRRDVYSLKNVNPL